MALQSINQTNNNFIKSIMEILNIRLWATLGASYPEPNCFPAFDQSQNKPPYYTAANETTQTSDVRQFFQVLLTELHLICLFNFLPRRFLVKPSEMCRCAELAK